MAENNFREEDYKTLIFFPSVNGTGVGTCILVC